LVEDIDERSDRRAYSECLVGVEVDIHLEQIATSKGHRRLGAGDRWIGGETKLCCSASKNCLKRAWALDLRTICELLLAVVSPRLRRSDLAPGIPTERPLDVSSFSDCNSVSVKLVGTGPLREASRL